MRSWLRRLMRLWLTVLVPSLVGWGLVVRLSGQGTQHFGRIWRWLAHLLTIPLILRPLTDRWWDWLAGGGLLAFVGFLLLIALWSLMLALPVNLLGAWLSWLSHRQPRAVGISNPGLDLAPTTRALYLITIPVALAGHALRWLLTGLPAALITFVVVAIARFGFEYTKLVNDGSVGFAARIAGLDRRWQGLYGTVGFHHLFAGAWSAHYGPTAQLAQHYLAQPYAFTDFSHHPNHYPDVLWLLVWDAVMFGLCAALAVLVVVALWKLVKRVG